MTKQDFLSIFSDAQQYVEGYADGTRSVRNNNVGNLKFVGQPKATPDADNFCIFPTFYDGKQAQMNDIQAKLDAGLDTIRDIITRYAPPTENDTESYISKVCAFFNWRGVPIKDTDNIPSFISSFSKPVVLVVLNQLYKPSDWHAIQQAISQCASYMPQYAFSCRYSNDYLLDKVININTIISPSTAIISGDATKAIIEPFNEGQTLNVMIYDGSIMQGHGTVAGGCEYQDIKIEPVSAVSSVLYNGPMFSDPLVRDLFHELIHELCTVEKIEDTLHTFLISAGGYMNNLAKDLLTYYNGNVLNTPKAVSNLVDDETNLIDTAEITMSEKLNWFQRLLNLLKGR